MANPIWDEHMRQLTGDSSQGSSAWRWVSLERNPFETVPGGFNSGRGRREPITNDSATDGGTSSSEPISTPTQLQRSGGSGDDRIRGSNDKDLISGNAGSDDLYGEDGDDLIDGGEGNDFILGGSGDDSLRGLRGDDTFVGGAGADFINGGAGSDTASYADSATGIRLNLALAQSYTGDAGGDQFRDVENVLGSQGDDVILVGTHHAAAFDAAGYLARHADVKAYIEANNLGEAWAYTHWLSWGRFEGRTGGWGASVMRPARIGARASTATAISPPTRTCSSTSGTTT